MSNETFEKGLAIRKQVLGEEYVNLNRTGFVGESIF